MTSSRKLAVALLLMLLLLAIGSAGYVVIEGYSLLDAVYMTVITLGTVGFREVEPLSDAGKLFTVFLIIAGIGSLAYVVTHMVEYLVSTILYRSRRMERSIDKLEKHVIVCGFGRIGEEVSERLERRGVPFVIVESDPAVSETLTSQGRLHIIGDATDDSVLLRARIDKAGTVVTALPTDADNVYVTLSARNLNPGIRIIARSIDSEARQKLLQAGADKVISPYDIGGRYIANAVMRPHVVNFMDVVSSAGTAESASLEIEELEITPASRYARKSLRETNIRSELNIIVLAIRTPDERVHYNPSPDIELIAGSTLICIGYAENLDRLARELGVKE